MLNLLLEQPVPALQKNRPNLTSLGDPYMASGTELATFYVVKYTTAFPSRQGFVDFRPTIYDGLGI